MDINKKIKLLDFKLTKSLWNSFFWVYKSKFVWNWIDFIEHKEYNFWNQIKNINWKTIGKTTKLYTKIFEEERDLKILFVIDINKKMNFWFFDKTKKEVLEEIFFTLSSSASFYWDSIGALLYDGKKNIFMPYKKWLFNIFSVIWELNKEENFSEIEENRSLKAFDYLNKINTQNTLIFIISDEIKDDLNNNLKILSKKNEIYYINIFDNFENNLINIDLDLSLWYNNDFLNISLNDNEKIKEYKKNRLSKINNFNNILAKNNISYKNIDTKDDVFKELYLFFNGLNR